MGEGYWLFFFDDFIADAALPLRQSRSIVLTNARASTASLPPCIELFAGTPEPAPIQMRADAYPPPTQLSSSLHVGIPSSPTFSMRASVSTSLQSPSAIQLSAGSVLHLMMLARVVPVAVPPVRICIASGALFSSFVARAPTGSSTPVFITVSAGVAKTASFPLREA